MSSQADREKAAQEITEALSRGIGEIWENLPPGTVSVVVVDERSVDPESPPMSIDIVQVG